MENKEDAMSAVKGILDTKSVTLLVSGLSKLMMIPIKKGPFFNDDPNSQDSGVLEEVMTCTMMTMELHKQTMITTTTALNLARRLSSLANYMRIAI